MATVKEVLLRDGQWESGHSAVVSFYIDEEGDEWIKLSNPDHPDEQAVYCIWADLVELHDGEMEFELGKT